MIRVWWDREDRRCLGYVEREGKSRDQKASNILSFVFVLKTIWPIDTKYLRRVGLGLL